MADEKNNPAPASGEDSNGQPPAGQPPVNDDAGLSDSSVDPAEQARRDQQSKKDKAESQKDDLSETVEYLSAREAERARDDFVKDLLAEDSAKYPNVQADDPMFKFATSKEDVTEIAANLQNKYKDMQQSALASVQVEADQGLTEKEIAEEEKKLEDQVSKDGQSKFGAFINTNLRRKK